MDPQQQDLVAQFSGITGANPSAAQTALQAANWNLQEAVSLFYAAHDDGQDAAEAYDSEPENAPGPFSSQASQPAPAPPAAFSSRRPQGGRPKQMTLEELKKMQEEEDDSDGEKKQDMFAGGEKSALAVQNPGQSGGPTDHFRNIMSQARQNRERPAGQGEEEQPAGSSNFSGRAQTLGGDDVDSTVIEDPLASARSGPQAASRVTRTLHLWADGISIDEGPLFRFDDPANQEMMAEINRGRAPLALLNVQPNQEVDLNLVPHKDENYVAPKQKYKPFAGQGQRLGSPTPGPGLPLPSASATATSQPQAMSAQAAPAVNVDESAPTVQLQIRLGDGTRLQSRFNTTHTIGDVYSFVDSASSSQRSYALMTTFPSKELNDRSLVLGDLSDFKRGGVVVQKYT